MKLGDFIGKNAADLDFLLKDEARKLTFGLGVLWHLKISWTGFDSFLIWLIVAVGYREQKSQIFASIFF